MNSGTFTRMKEPALVVVGLSRHSRSASTDGGSSSRAGGQSDERGLVRLSALPQRSRMLEAPQSLRGPLVEDGWLRRVEETLPGEARAKGCHASLWSFSTGRASRGMGGGGVPRKRWRYRAITSTSSRYWGCEGRSSAETSPAPRHGDRAAGKPGRVAQRQAKRIAQEPCEPCDEPDVELAPRGDIGRYGCGDGGEAGSSAQAPGPQRRDSSPAAGHTARGVDRARRASSDRSRIARGASRGDRAGGRCRGRPPHRAGGRAIRRRAQPAAAREERPPPVPSVDGAHRPSEIRVPSVGSKVRRTGRTSSRPRTAPNMAAPRAASQTETLSVSGEAALAGAGASAPRLPRAGSPRASGEKPLIRDPLRRSPSGERRPACVAQPGQSFPEPFVEPLVGRLVVLAPGELLRQVGHVRHEVPGVVVR